MSAMKVTPETQWHVEIETIDSDRFDVSFTLVKNGMPIGGIGSDMRRQELEHLVVKLQAALAATH